MTNRKRISITILVLLLVAVMFVGRTRVFFFTEAAVAHACDWVTTNSPTS
jgi:hypothetical protein